MSITSINDDVEIVLADYDLRDKGPTQFYVGSTRVEFDELMEKVRVDAGIVPEKHIKHILISAVMGSAGGITERVREEPGNLLVSAYGFAELNLRGHTLNQMAHYHTGQHEKYILGIHINSESEIYGAVVSTARDSQFKVRVIEFREIATKSFF